MTPPSIYASSRPMGKKSPPHHPEKTNLCWYHAKFGHKARACRPPCAYSCTLNSRAPSTGTFGKRTGQNLVAQVSGQSQSHLLYVCDRNSGHKFLVDTGAQISVFPASAHERRSQKTEPLIASCQWQHDRYLRQENHTARLGLLQVHMVFCSRRCQAPDAGCRFLLQQPPSH